MTNRTMVDKRSRVVPKMSLVIAIDPRDYFEILSSFQTSQPVAE